MTTQPEKPALSVNIPFSGFYDSLWSGEFDHIEEREAEYYAKALQDAENIPVELRLDESDFADIFLRVADYPAMYASAAHAIADGFNNLASEELGFELGMSFEEMTSPREYNFETDRIFMHIPRASVAKLFRMARRDGFAKLRAEIARRHTSCSGFISSYSNCLHDWLSKPLSQWDHNEVGTLLRACLGSDLNENLDLYYAVCDGDKLFSEWSENIDWPKFEELVTEKRAKLLAEKKELDPEYVPPTPRCPYTLDLFERR